MASRIETVQQHLASWPADRDGAFVTGSSKGIGAAIAARLAKEGLAVVVHYNRDRKGAEKVVADLAVPLGKARGAWHCCIGGNLAEKEEAASVFSKAVDFLERAGVRLRCVVNNAGIFETHCILSRDMSLDMWASSWRRTLSVNLESAAFISFLAARHWLNEGRPHVPRSIVMISSRGAYRGEPDAPAYGASKAAMNAMAQSLAKALGGPLNVSVSSVVRLFALMHRLFLCHCLSLAPTYPYLPHASPLSVPRLPVSLEQLWQRMFSQDQEDMRFEHSHPLAAWLR